MAPVPTAADPFLPTAAELDKPIRPDFIRDEDERPKVAYNAFSSDIPVISLSGLDSDSDRPAIRQRIVEACEAWGVFQVVDHGVDPALVASMASLARDFFALPAEEKLRYDMTGGKKGGFLVSSHLKDEAVRDWREIVTFFSYPVASRDYSRWPGQPAEWRGVAEAYSVALMGLAYRILEVLSEAMGLDKGALADACVDTDQKMVVNYYPKCPQPDLTLGLKRHTDPGTITILLQDQVGGLQATSDGGNTWITVLPIEGAFVINLGDHCHYLSNGRFKNADHQAVVNSDCSRLSIATFQNPAPEAIVYPLAVREGEKPILDEPISYAEMYRRKMSRDIELANLKKQARTEVLAKAALEPEEQLLPNVAEHTKDQALNKKSNNCADGILQPKPLEQILA